jgi:hypothetical protein
VSMNILVNQMFKTHRVVPARQVEVIRCHRRGFVHVEVANLPRGAGAPHQPTDLDTRHSTPLRDIYRASTTILAAQF